MLAALQLFLLSATVLFQVVCAQTWCGKNYMASSPIVPPGGQFPVPATSSTPLLAFRCAPAIRPYLPEDALQPAAILVDTPVTYAAVAGAVPLALPAHGALPALAVSVSHGGRTLAAGRVPLNASKAALPFSLAGLQPRMEAFELTCTATLEPGAASGAETQEFTASAALSFLPDPPAGRSVTKMDLRTGALLAKPATGEEGDYQTVFPVGFYTTFGGYLATNLSIIDEVKAQGFTVIHPVPTFDNLTALEEVVERMQEQGLYLMYDMRWTYMNATAVEEEVNRIKNHPNLLLWYTGDEPDGTSDPLNATVAAYDQIYDLDGYHPVSLVLNCQNYYWTEYTAGTDIVMQDTYMIGNNVTFSNQWGTPCTVDYGDCGCDNCKGEFEDISTRMDEFAQRLFVNGWDRTKAVWTVPQAFGNASYWTRVPTGKEYVVQSVLAINHGALGAVAWDAPTTDDIQASAAALARALAATLQDFVASPHAAFRHVVQGRVDAGVWTVGARTLVLATNLEYAEAAFALAAAGVRGGPAVQAFDGGATLDVARGVVTLEPVGTGGFILG